jgi:hypothetical protein
MGKVVPLAITAVCVTVLPYITVFLIARTLYSDELSACKCCRDTPFATVSCSCKSMGQKYEYRKRQHICL